MVKRVKNTLTAIYGAEPVFNGIGVVSQSKLVSYFTWYNNCANTKKKKNWFIEWSLKNGYNKSDFSHVSDFYFVTLGALSRMISRGYQTSEKDVSWMTNKINSMLIDNPKPVLVTNKKRKNTDDTLMGKIMYSFDSVIDSVLSGKRSFVLKPIDNSLKKNQTKELYDYYLDQLSELKLVYDKSDEDLMEGYSSISRRVQTKLIQVYNEILVLIKNEESKNTVIRKVRTKKQLKPNLKKLNYQKTEKLEDLVMVSVNPEKILGAKKLVTYNTKYRKIGIYYAKNESGFSVKGSTLQNFTSESSSKILRKPEQMLPDFIKSPRVRTDKLFDLLTSKSVKLTGRLNNNTILLKVF